MTHDSTRQIKTGALLSYAALMVSMAVTLAYTPFMLRQLGQAEYGLFALVNTTIAYLTILDFGFGNAIVRYTAKYRAEQDRAKEESLHGMFLLLYVGIGLLAFLLALVLVFNVEWMFSAALTKEELVTAKILMWLAAINLGVSFPFSVFSSIVSGYERFIYAKALNLVRLIINPLLMVLILLLGFKAVGLIAATTVLNSCFNMSNLYYCKKHLNMKMRFSEFDGGLFKEICGYSFFVFLNLIVDRLYWTTGQFLLGVFVGTAAVAVYSIGLQFVNSLYIPFSTATSGMFLPRVTQISLKETPERELSDMFIKVGRIQFIILGLILTGFYLYGRQFIHLWAGPDYAQSYLVALILMVPLTIPLIQNLGISILQARNMHAFRSVVYLVIAIVNVAISIPMIKWWGPAGCAIGTAASLVAGQIVIMNLYYRSRIKLQIIKFWVEIFKMGPAMVMSLAVGMLVLKWMSANHIVGLAVNVVVYTAVYCLIIYFGGMNLYEKGLIRKPLMQIASRVGMGRGVL
jgi:O-antigen/teichoic acid export membrane protein